MLMWLAMLNACLVVAVVVKAQAITAGCSVLGMLGKAIRRRWP